jgi:thiamine-monophosphate kinase
MKNNILGKEFDCIEKIKEITPNMGIGDDCVFLKELGGAILSVDNFVEGIHFDMNYFKPSDVGYRACEASLSDIAACGGKALFVLIAISAPSTELILHIYNGVSKSLTSNNVKLIGGDTTNGHKITISVTVIGKPYTKMILRSTAKINENIYITGYTGLSAGGLYCLQKKIKGFNTLKTAHKRPKAKLNLSRELSKIATSMIDISDGLVSELYHIANQSNLSIVIDELPIHKDLIKLTEHKDNEINPKDLALNGGEDFELLYTTNKETVSKKLGFKIGRTIEPVNNKICVYILDDTRLKLLEPKGFKHF